MYSLLPSSFCGPTCPKGCQLETAKGGMADCEALIFDLETWNLQDQVTDEGPEGYKS